MKNNVEIQGLERVYEMYDNGQREFIKASVKASRKAASGIAKDIRRGIPSKFRRMVKSRVKSGRSGLLTVRIGIFNDSGLPKGGKIPDWFKAYWQNYGTLTKRDPSHSFKSPVKPANSANGRRRRNSVGQGALNFFEASSSGWERRYYDDFKASLEQQGYDMEGK